MTRVARLPTARQAELAAALAPAPESAELRRARRLKAAIEAYWRERGCAVTVQLEPLSVAKCSDSFNTFRAYALVSSTRNGLPAGDAA